MVKRRRRRIRRLVNFGPGRLLFVLLSGIIVVLGIGTWAGAFFASQASATGSVSVGVLNPPTIVVATLPNPALPTVNVNWSVPIEAAGITLDGYYVQRYLGANPSPACGTSPTTLVSAASCDDTRVASGTYTYVVTAVFRSWTAASSPSGPVTVTFNAPPTTDTLTYQGGSATSGTAPSDPSSPYASGATVTVLANTGNLAEAGFTFSGWNTQSNGLGTSYTPGATFSISANTVLYAVFSPIAPPTTDTQIAPFSGTSTVGDASSFTIQLNVAGNTGAVTFTTTSGHSSDYDKDNDSDAVHLRVSSSGVVTGADGPLEAGTYTVSGTMKDAAGDNGTWTYTLTVIASTITQIAPFSGTTTFHDSLRFSTQLNVTGATGAVTFLATSVSSIDNDSDHDSAHVKVSSSGVVTVDDGPLEAGTYTVSGTMKDAAGDNGTWTYTLTVKSDRRGEKHE